MSGRIEEEFEGLSEPINAALKEAVARSATGGEKWDALDMIRKFELKRDLSERGAVVGAVREPPRVSVRTNGSWVRIMSITAVILVVIIATIWGGSRTAPTTTGPAQTFSTRPGQRASFTLADGSRVILAPASKLVVSSEFNKSSRAINLDGEAYFSVTAHTDAPFVVNTGNQATRVLGTSFSVRKYLSDSSSLRVIVAEGRVQVVSEVVGAGQGIIVSPAGNTMLSDNEVSAGLAWTDGRLVFINASVRDVITQLERWYGVKFVGVDSELAASRFSTTLQGDVLTDNMLRSLGTALGRRLERRGREVMVKNF